MAAPYGKRAKIAATDDATTQPAWPGQDSELRPCVILIAAVYGALVLAWQGAQLPYIGTALMTAVAWMQLWFPVMRADHTGAPLKSLGLHSRALNKELRDTGLLAAVLLVPWATVVLWSSSHRPGPSIGASWQLWTFVAAGDFVLTQVLGVALPEELFWRGYVMQVLHARWPKPWLGLSCGAWLAAVLFALGHLAQTLSLARLATFFPGLIFCALMQRRRSIVGPWLLHTLCNLSSAAVGARF